MDRRTIIGGIILLGGVGLLVVVARNASASSVQLQQEMHEQSIAEAIAACPPGDRDCVMRIQYAAVGRDWDAENDQEYRAALSAQRAQDEADRIRADRAARWAHL